MNKWEVPHNSMVHKKAKTDSVTALMPEGTASPALPPTLAR